jgi:hypothetical protein
LSAKAIYLLLGFGLVAVVSAVAVLIRTQDPAQQDKLWIEVGKGLIQLAVIGVLGTILKLVADGHQARRERADHERDIARERADRERDLEREQADHERDFERERADRNHEFRADKRARLVAVTNALRKAPIAIQGDRSVESWTEHMMNVIDAGFELRAVKHEIDASRTAPDSPFSADSVRRVLSLLESMQEYIDEFAGDYEQKRRLEDLQRSADAEEISPEDRTQKKSDLWAAISSLDGFSDMMSFFEGKKSARVSRRYSKYELNYQKAIEAITRESLAGSDRETV